MKVNTRLAIRFVIALVFFCFLAPYSSAQVTLDESPAKVEELGHQPAEGLTVAVNPPSFVWRANKDIISWELIVRNETNAVVYEAKKLSLNTNTPPKEFKPGRYSWQFRGIDNSGKPTAWSLKRNFTVPKDARIMPLPTREKLLGSIPKKHPRVFVRPEGMAKLRELAKGKLAADYQSLVEQCEKILREPPDLTEPPTFKAGKFNFEELDIWWDNRVRTIAALESAATLAFVWNLDGNEQYAALAKKILLATAKWDPKGSTGFIYNDEAGMPYNYHFSRTYTFLNSYLNEGEKQICRDVMRIRGKEMYDFICPRLLFFPYGSHDGRSWHKLGEIGLAFYGEIPEAGDWLWFVMNKFYCAYPGWNDDDGGWHQGVTYWESYQNRFCWWADAMLAAFGINAFDKPYYSQIGFYPMYQMPPGKRGRLFADLNHNVSSLRSLSLVDIVALQSGNPYWKWYIEAHEDYQPPSTYYTFIRKAASFDRPPVIAKKPTDLPTSKQFRGIGLVASNTSLLDASENVQLLFKSAPAPFGTVSHGYDANNSFIFSAWNEDLLINTGRRDYFGSAHHNRWMASTKSQNNIMVDGVGQMGLSNRSVGEIVRFVSTKLNDGSEYDIIVGEASEGYRLDKDAPDVLVKKYPDGKLLDGYRRYIVFLKPDVLIVYDRLKATRPATFEYWLHAKHPFRQLDHYFPGGKSKGAKSFEEELDKLLGPWKLTEPGAPDRIGQLKRQTDIGVWMDKVACRIDLLIPEGLTLTQTNQYDHPQEPQYNFTDREWHLTARTTNQKQDGEFLMIVRPWKVDQEENVPAIDARWERQGRDLLLHVKSNGKTRTIRFPGESDNVVVQ